MKKDGKNKANAALVMMMLVLSMVVVLTTLPTVGAAPTIDGVENNYSGICGEQIWINASGFTAGSYVYLNFSGENLKKAYARDGDFNTTFYVPWQSIPDDYLLELTEVGNSTNYVSHNFTITDVYKVEVEPEVIYWDDTEAQDFTIKIWNWTGKSYSLLYEKVRYIFWEPDFQKDVINGTTSDGSETTAALFNWSYMGNREANYTLNITMYDAPYTVLASVWVPVRFHLINLAPTTATYGETKTLRGRFIDGGDDYVQYLEYVQILSPTGHFWLDPVKTNVNGDFTFAMYFNESGTWYVGTNVTGAGYRPMDDETTRGQTNFIWYDKVEVNSAEGAITVDPDETTYGFNISFDIYCEDANEDPAPLGSYVYVEGVELEYPAGDNHTRTNFTYVGTTTDGWLNITKADEFKFKESGTATFWLYYNGTYEYYDTHEDELPKLIASTKVDVGTPDPMNVFVDYDAKAVFVDDNDTSPPLYGATWTDENNWWNLSFPLNVTVYGKTDEISKMKNASITVTGCGLDLEFEEKEQDPNGYQYFISPRNMGVLTITVTNETSGISVEEDVEIDGLVSNAVTSIGDDKEITVDKEETISFTVNDAYWAEVHVNLFDENWGYLWEAHDIIYGDNTEGNGSGGIYEFMPEVDNLGHIVIAAKAGFGPNIFYTYDIVDIVPEHDLVINITTPEAGNLTLTAGLEYDIIVDIYNLTGAEITSEVNEVYWELLDENNSVLEDGNFDDVSGNTWQIEDQIFTQAGTLLITAIAYDGKHDGNNSDISVGLAVFEYMPSGLTIGINSKDVSVDVIAYDAVGDLLTDLEFTMNQTNAANTTIAGNSTAPMTDEYGEETIWFSAVGNELGSFCARLAGGTVNTSGELEIGWPIFTVNPNIIYVGYMAEINIKAENQDGEPIPWVNLTLTPSSKQETGGVIPDPIWTGEDGWLIEPISIQPAAVGTLNITIAHNITYTTAGQLTWTSLLTDTVIKVQAIKPMEMSPSSYSVYEGDTLTVTVTSNHVALSGADVKFGDVTKQTGSDGTAEFIVPDPQADSATWTLTGSKAGYITQTLPITVMTVYDVIITTPKHVYAGETFTVTVSAKGSVLVGIPVMLDDGAQIAMTGSDGKASFKASSKVGTTHTITAEFGNYDPGSATVTVEEKKTPGFELLTLIIAIGVAFILLRRRRN